MPKNKDVEDNRHFKTCMACHAYGVPLVAKRYKKDNEELTYLFCEVCAEQYKTLPPFPPMLTYDKISQKGYVF